MLLLLLLFDFFFRGVYSCFSPHLASLRFSFIGQREQFPQYYVLSSDWSFPREIQLVEYMLQAQAYSSLHFAKPLGLKEDGFRKPHAAKMKIILVSRFVYPEHSKSKPR